jgi:transcription initiation factor IIE alpha subunit
MLQPDVQCMVCGRDQEENETFLETVDGFICPECGGDIDDTDTGEQEDNWTLTQDDNENPLDY